ncbi:MAG: hypothetical protein AB7S38_43620 [Vulcanimicrobiota bacterium]
MAFHFRGARDMFTPRNQTTTFEVAAHSVCRGKSQPDDPDNIARACRRAAKALCKLITLVEEPSKLAS